MMMVSAERKKIVQERVADPWISVFNEMSKIGLERKLTEVQAHADENYQAKPGVEVGDEVNDGNDNISDGGEDAEHDVTGRQRRSSIMVRSVQENDTIWIKEWWFKMLGLAGPIYQLQSALEPTPAILSDQFTFTLRFGSIILC